MWVADLADTAAVDRLGLRAWDDLGGIDVLVNNAATPKRRAVEALDPADVEAVMRVNFFAPMRLTLAILPRMLARGHGVIVNVSSVVAGWASFTKPPTVQANSRCAGGASQWPSTCTAPAFR